jgi:hypothetical protein
MAAKIFLTIVELIYMALAFWCALDPATTSEKIGLKIEGGTGKSEFLTVYGGLEFGLALILLVPLVKPEFTQFALLSCLLVHGSLAVFRTIGFFAFEEIGGFTYRLAIGEWAIFLISVALWFWAKNGSTT